jgi:hypothetical protein
MLLALAKLIVTSATLKVPEIVTLPAGAVGGVPPSTLICTYTRLPNG